MAYSLNSRELPSDILEQVVRAARTLFIIIDIFNQLQYHDALRTDD